MDFRLGEYECPSCGHNEAQVKQAEAQQGSGPGFKQQWKGPTRPGSVAPPPPPPGTVYQPGQSIPGSITGYDAAPPPTTDGLTIEKHIYFGLQAIGGLVMVVIIGMGMNALSGAGGAFQGQSFGAAGTVGGIIGAIIGLAVLAFVLYGTEVWSKWCCGGCVTIGLLASIPTLFIAPTAANDFSGGPITFIQIAFNLWFLSILWRDIQRLKG